MMSFEWDEINEKWLLDLPSKFTKNELLRAFRSIEKEYGMDFFNTYVFFRGEYIAKLVYDLSTILEEEKKGSNILPKHGEIYNTIKNREVNKLFNLIGLMAFFIMKKLKVESEPIVKINNVKKRPDFRAKYNEEWIYFEETKYEISDRQKELLLILDEISKMLEEVNRSIKIEVITLTDVDENKATQIKEIVHNQCLIKDQPQLIKIPDLVTVLTYEEDRDKFPSLEVRGSICMATAIIGSGFIRNLNVAIPFRDLRVSNILAKKDQLSVKEQNIIITDLSKSGDIKKISEILEDKIIQKKHNKIGAIILIENSFYVKEMKTEYKLILNENAIKPISLNFIKLLKEYFDSMAPLLIRKITQ